MRNFGRMEMFSFRCAQFLGREVLHGRCRDLVNVKLWLGLAMWRKLCIRVWVRVRFRGCWCFFWRKGRWRSFEFLRGLRVVVGVDGMEVRCFEFFFCLVVQVVVDAFFFLLLFAIYCCLLILNFLFVVELILEWWGWMDRILFFVWVCVLINIWYA